MPSRLRLILTTDTEIPCPELAKRFEVKASLRSGEGWAAQVSARAGCLDETDTSWVLKILDRGHAPREASLVASLRHASIPRILELGHTQEGRVYILREFVPGSPLSQAYPDDPKEVQQLGVRLLEILAFVHARGILHLDIKPDNVIVGEHGRVHLLDFGLGGREGSDGLDGGSPYFAAPERHLGVSADAHHDLYALGVLLFEALRHHDAKAQPPTGIRFRQRLLEVGFWGAVDCSPDSLPRPFDNVLRHLLARDRNDRVYGDAHDLLDALVRGSGRPSLERLRPDPISLYREAIAIAVQEAGEANVWIEGGDAETQAAVAIHLASELPHHRIQDTGIDSVAGRIGVIPLGETATAEKTLSLRTFSKNAISEHLSRSLRLPAPLASSLASRLLSEVPETSGQAVFRWLETRVLRADIVADGPHWRCPQVLAGRELAPLSTQPFEQPKTAGALRNLAARGQVDAALAAFRALKDLSPEHDQRWRHALAEGLLATGEPGRALPFTAGSTLLRARALFDTGAIHSAREELSDLASKDPEIERLRASIDLVQGRSLEAQQTLKQVLESHPALATEITYGQALMAGGETDSAYRWFTDLQQRDLSSAPSFLRAALHTCTGEVARRRNEFATAEREYRAALYLLRTLGHARHVASTTSSLGAIAKDAGDYAEANRLHREAFSMFQLAGDRSGSALAMANLGICALVAGDSRGAVEQLSRAVDELRQCGDSLHLPLILLRSAQAHLKTARREDAQSMLDEAEAIGIPQHLRDEATALRTRIEDSSEGLQEHRNDSLMSQPPKALDEPDAHDDLRTLRALIRRIATEPDLERVMNAIIDGAVMLTGGRAGYLLLLREESLRREYHTGGTQSLAFSRSLANRAVQSQRVQTSDDVVNDPELLEMPSVRNLAQRSAVCVPFRDAHGHRGALYVENAGRAQAFGSSHVKSLEGLADLAATAIRVLNCETEAPVNAEAQPPANPPQRRRRARGATKILGSSASVVQLRDEIRKVARSDLAVLVRGETGTGKELVARSIHEHSDRSSHPFIALNCSAIPDQLMESELFGHAQGAFTGADSDRAGLMESASGGTLFLDEIGDMPSSLQAKLLRAIQDGNVRRVGASSDIPVDTRIVSATHKDLALLIQTGDFREDLYFRIVGIELNVSPLRERGADIELLAEAFLAERNAKAGRSVVLSEDARRELYHHSWPGNVREVHHAIARAHLLCDGDQIEHLDIGMANPRRGVGASDDVDLPQGPSRPAGIRPLRDVETEAIRAALVITGGDKTRAARELGISRTALYDKLRRIDGSEKPPAPPQG